MRQKRSAISAALALAALAAAGPLAAQLQVPGLPVPAPGVGGVLGEVTGRAGDTLGSLDRTAAREARRLLAVRDRALDRLLARHPEAIERDAGGNLARRGALLVTGAAPADLAALERAGFTVATREVLEGLGLEIVRLSVPPGLALPRAEALAARLAPGAEISPDHLHFAAAAAAAPAQPSATAAARAAAASLSAAAATATATGIGMIDAGAGPGIAVTAQKGFAAGAPKASDHGSAVASLLHGAGARRIMVADVYGSDPAGGNALAIARALGWLAASGCKVVTISLVGPRNAALERAVAAAQARGVVVVAAVGNDGPAAPPAFPASYAGVLAITGTDRKGRALIEAGRALHLDYAAPGAGVHAADARGKARVWRGTSFAAPLAAARVAAALETGGAGWRARLDAEARDLGKKGPDAVYGRGLLCGSCGQKE